MSFFDELQRRSVIKVAIAYAAVAWLIAQVAELVLDAVAAPGWIIKTVLLLLAIGFPIALIFAWAYEITPEGIRLDKGGGRSPEKLLPRRVVMRRRIAWTASIAVVALLALNIGTIGDWIGAPAAGEISSIAVLPLENLMGGSEQDYFVDGMTEALTAAVGQIKALKVTSRTSADLYRSTDKTMPEIARELGVEAILEGSVLRDGEEVRITLQLIHGPTDSYIWAENYQRKLRNILTLQDEIARAIAKKMQITLTPDTETGLARERQVDPKAYESWLIGNFHLTQLNEDSFNKALNEYEEAIAKDPKFASAWAGKAMAHVMLASWHASGSPAEVIRLAEVAALEALQLDPDLGDAHMALGIIREFQWQWDSAESSYKQGLELNPNDALGLVKYSNFLTIMGRFDDAVRIARLALALDPLPAHTRNEVGFALWMAGRDEEALEIYRESLAIDAEFPQTHDVIAELYLRRGVHARTPEERQHEFELAREHVALFEQYRKDLSPSDMGLKGRQYAMLGQPEKALQYLSELTKLRENGRHVSAVALADVYVGLGEYDEALKWLNKAFDEHDTVLIWLKADWTYNELLASDPRYQELLGRMNFPEA